MNLYNFSGTEYLESQSKLKIRKLAHILKLMTILNNCLARD